MDPEFCSTHELANTRKILTLDYYNFSMLKLVTTSAMMANKNTYHLYFFLDI